MHLACAMRPAQAPPDPPEPGTARRGAARLDPATAPRACVLARHCRCPCRPVYRVESMTESRRAAVSHAPWRSARIRDPRTRRRPQSPTRPVGPRHYAGARPSPSSPLTHPPDHLAPSRNSHIVSSTESETGRKRARARHTSGQESLSTLRMSPPVCPLALAWPAETDS